MNAINIQQVLINEYNRNKNMEEEEYYDDVDDEDMEEDKNEDMEEEEYDNDETEDVQEDEPSCSICLEVFIESGGMVYALPCSHCFHIKCLNFTVERHKRCPICRSHIDDKVIEDIMLLI